MCTVFLGIVAVNSLTQDSSSWHNVSQKIQGFWHVMCCWVSSSCCTEGTEIVQNVRTTCPVTQHHVLKDASPQQHCCENQNFNNVKYLTLLYLLCNRISSTESFLSPKPTGISLQLML